MSGVSLGISVSIGVHVHLAICLVICSDFEGILSVWGSGEGVSCAGVKRLWLDLRCCCRSGQYSCQPWEVS